MEVVWSVMSFCRSWYRRDAAAVGCCGAVFFALGDGAVMGQFYGTLSGGTVLGPVNVTLGARNLVGYILVRYVSSISAGF